MPLFNFLFSWSGLRWNSIRPGFCLSGRNDVEEIFVGDELSILVNYRDCGLEVPVVKRIDDGTHYDETLSLRNQILFNSSHLLAISLIELALLVVDLEVTSAEKFLVLLATAICHKALGVFLKLELDLFEDA